MATSSAFLAFLLPRYRPQNVPIACCCTQPASVYPNLEELRGCSGRSTFCTESDICQPQSAGTAKSELESLLLRASLSNYFEEESKKK